MSGSTERLREPLNHLKDGTAKTTVSKKNQKHVVASASHDSSGASACASKLVTPISSRKRRGSTATITNKTTSPRPAPPSSSSPGASKIPAARGVIPGSDLNAYDVLVGRGNGVARNPGNRFFRCVVWNAKEDYCNASNPDKIRIAQQQVLDVIKARGGRVLEKLTYNRSSGTPSNKPKNKNDHEEGSYYLLVPKSRALEKTCQALREKGAKPPDGYQDFCQEKKNLERGLQVDGEGKCHGIATWEEQSLLSTTDAFETSERASSSSLLASSPSSSVSRSTMNKSEGNDKKRSSKSRQTKKHTPSKSRTPKESKAKTRRSTSASSATRGRSFCRTHIETTKPGSTTLTSAAKSAQRELRWDDVQTDVHQDASQRELQDSVYDHLVNEAIAAASSIVWDQAPLDLESSRINLHKVQNEEKSNHGGYEATDSKKVDDVVPVTKRVLVSRENECSDPTSAQTLGYDLQPTSCEEKTSCGAVCTGKHDSPPCLSLLSPSTKSQGRASSTAFEPVSSLFLKSSSMVLSRGSSAPSSPSDGVLFIAPRPTFPLQPQAGSVSSLMTCPTVTPLVVSAAERVKRNKRSKSTKNSSKNRVCPKEETKNGGTNKTQGEADSLVPITPRPPSAILPQYSSFAALGLVEGPPTLVSPPTDVVATTPSRKTSSSRSPKKRATPDKKEKEKKQRKRKETKAPGQEKSPKKRRTRKTPSTSKASSAAPKMNSGMQPPMLLPRAVVSAACSLKDDHGDRSNDSPSELQAKTRSNMPGSPSTGLPSDLDELFAALPPSLTAFASGLFHSSSSGWSGKPHVSCDPPPLKPSSSKTFGLAPLIPRPCLLETAKDEAADDEEQEIPPALVQLLRSISTMSQQRQQEAEQSSEQGPPPVHSAKDPNDSVTGSPTADQLVVNETEDEAADIPPSLVQLLRSISQVSNHNSRDEDPLQPPFESNGEEDPSDIPPSLVQLLRSISQISHSSDKEHKEVTGQDHSGHSFASANDGTSEEELLQDLLAAEEFSPDLHEITTEIFSEGQAEKEDRKVENNDQQEVPSANRVPPANVRAPRMTRAVTHDVDVKGRIANDNCEDQVSPHGDSSGWSSSEKDSSTSPRTVMDSLPPQENQGSMDQEPDSESMKPPAFQSSRSWTFPVEPPSLTAWHSLQEGEFEKAIDTSKGPSTSYHQTREAVNAIPLTVLPKYSVPFKNPLARGNGGPGRYIPAVLVALGDDEDSDQNSMDPFVKNHRTPHRFLGPVQMVRVETTPTGESRMILTGLPPPSWPSQNRTQGAYFGSRGPTNESSAPRGHFWMAG